MDPLILYMPGIVLLGILTCIDDFRTGRVRNKYVAGAILYGITALSISLLAISVSGNGINWSLVAEHLSNMTLTIVIGFFIWYLGLWGAGDAKLFIAYAALLPLTVYEWGRIRNFPAIIILINTLVPLFLYHLAIILKNIGNINIRNIPTDFLRPVNLLMQAVVIFSLQWISIILLRVIGYTLDMFISIFIIYFLFLLAMKIFGENFNKAIFCIAIARVLIDSPEMITQRFWVIFGIVFALFILLRYILQLLTHELFTHSIFIENLRAGMFPAENIFKTKEGYVKQQIIFPSIISDFANKQKLGEPLFSQPADGMTDGEIAELKKLHSRGKFKSHTFKIFQTVSFALCLFAGVILTILIRGNVLFFIKDLIERAFL